MAGKRDGAVRPSYRQLTNSNTSARERLEIDSRRDLSQLRPGQLAGNDKGDAGYGLADLGEEFLEVEIAGNSGQMRIKIIRAF